MAEELENQEPLNSEQAALQQYLIKTKAVPGPQSSVSGLPDAVQRPAQFPTATRIEDGVAYDISGKKLGQVADDEPAETSQSAKPKFDPNQPIQMVGASAVPAASAKPKFNPNLPIQPMQAPTAKPAFKPADESYAGHNFDPLDLGDWRKAYFGPATAAGQPQTPAMQEELSGISDIGHGDIRKGLGKIFSADSMHVVQGSPVERLIKLVNPNFKGGVDQNYVDANTRKEAPLVDAAQFINKDEHPVVKALTEVAQSLTTPANTAIMIGTGGLGMVSGPGLAVANKLLSAGFTAQAVGQAYRNLEGFKKAYDEGNGNEAIYQLTHAVANGTMGYLAGAHTAGVETPLVGNLEKRAVGAVSRAVEPITAKLGQAANKMGFGEDFETLVKKTSPPSKGKAADYGDQVKEAAPFLKDVLNKNPDIETPKDFVDAIEQRRKAIDLDLINKAKAVRGTPEAEMPNIEQRVDKALDKAFDEQGARYKPEERDTAKQAVKNFLLQNEETGGETTLRQPDLFDVEKIRQRFNDDTRPIFGQDPGTIPPATNFAKKIAADEMRQAIDEKHGDLGTEGVKEWRKLESNIIPVRDQLELAQKKSEEMGQFSILHSAIKNVGWPVVLGALAHSGPIGLAVEALKVGQDYLTDRVKNPNTLVRRAAASAEEAGPQNPNVPTKTRENTPLHAELATHYGEALGKSEIGDLEDRFLKDVAVKQQNKVPLEPAEKTLLSKVNHSKVEEISERKEAADKARLEVDKAAQEVEKEKKDKEAQGLNTNLSIPFDTESELDLPANYTGHGYTGPRLRAHELGHQIMVDEFGHPTGDIISHLHDKIDKGAAAEARWDKSEFQDENGKWDQAKLLMNIPDILAIYHGGPIAEELVHGVPIEKNPGARGDLKRAKGILKELGFSSTETGMMMKAAELKAREVLTSPGVKDIIERYTQAREAGLDEGLHMHPETIGAAVQEVRNAKGGGNVGNKNTNTGRAAEGSREGKPGGKSKPANPAKEAARPAGEAGAGPRSEVREGPKTEVQAGVTERLPKVENLRVPPERSTGEYDEPIKQGGGIPGGIQKGDPEIDLPDLALFHDPATGSTLALPVDKVSVETVKQQLKKSRDMYLAAEDRKAGKIDYDKAFREHEGEQ